MKNQLIVTINYNEGKEDIIISENLNDSSFYGENIYIEKTDSYEMETTDFDGLDHYITLLKENNNSGFVSITTNAKNNTEFFRIVKNQNLTTV